MVWRALFATAFSLVFVRLAFVILRDGRAITLGTRRTLTRKDNPVRYRAAFCFAVTLALIAFADAALIVAGIG